MKNIKGYFILLALAAVLGGSFCWIARTNDSLRREQVFLRSQLDEIARLKAGNARLQIALPAEEELQKLTQVSLEGSELRERIDKLNETQRRLSRQLQKRAEERWLNVGLATPTHTLGSVVWAATGGEVDLLASMLAYDAESRAAADELFAAIPPATRALFPSADKLVATFIAGRLPTNFTEVQVVEQTEKSADIVLAKVRLQRSNKAGDPPREVTFRFQRTGADWRLVVPPSVISEFRRSLRAK